MDDDRPRKRQKVLPKRNPFVDDEAAVDSDEPDTEIEDDGKSSYEAVESTNNCKWGVQKGSYRMS